MSIDEILTLKLAYEHEKEAVLAMIKVEHSKMRPLMNVIADEDQQEVIRRMAHIMILFANAEYGEKARDFMDGLMIDIDPNELFSLYGTGGNKHGQTIQ